jgi:hypothetical protein
MTNEGWRSSTRKPQQSPFFSSFFGTFTLEPTMQDGEPVYLAHGKVDFFGDEAMARTGGAGGQNRTGYACLFRAALYQ